MLRRFIISMMLMLIVPLSALGQDVVVVKSSTNSQGSSKRRGTIVEWKGSQLTLLSNGKERRIDNESILEVQTRWNKEYLAGKEALSQLDFPSAIARFRLALSDEGRAWAQQLIRARLVEAHLGVGDYPNAIRDFIALTRDDPQTRYFHLIPLAWTQSSLQTSATVQLAKPLAKSQDITARLIAASWMLNDVRAPDSRTQANEILESLSNDIEPRIAQLATMQLWRTAVLSANENEVRFWEAQSKKFDPSIRYGARLLIAQAKSRMSSWDEAAIGYMSLPILHPEQHSLIPTALYEAGVILRRQNENEQATTVWRELVNRYPETPLAKQIASQIQEPSR